MVASGKIIQLSKIHLFVVHVGEFYPVHFHNLVSDLDFGIRQM